MTWKLQRGAQRTGSFHKGCRGRGGLTGDRSLVRQVVEGMLSEELGTEMSWLVTERISRGHRAVFAGRRVGRLAQGTETIIDQDSSTEAVKLLEELLEDSLGQILCIVFTVPTLKKDTHLELTQRKGARNLLICLCINQYLLSAC